MKHRPPNVPGYELVQCLGGGPISQVYSARPADGDELCAIKLLRCECADDPTAVKLLQREARAGLAVAHPHLVRVLEAHVTREPYFLVLELLGGESLRQRLRREYALDLPTALWVARQSAEALAALHRAGFVHGDVKPDNVRLADAGKAVLIDLGFAHRPGENAALLEDGFVLGTANYLSPELCGPGSEDEPPADVFSLGVTLFEMLTGELPYPPGSALETMTRHRDEAPSDLRDHAGPWPPKLALLVAGMMVKRARQRPSANAVVRELIALEIATLRRRSA